MTQQEKLVGLLSDGNVWRLVELGRQGIAATVVSRAVEEGTVERLSRGMYRSAGAVDGEHPDLVLAAARTPAGVACLFTAAGVHGFGDVVPDEVWLAIPNGHRPPRLDWPRLRVLRWRSAASLTLGVETRQMDGVTVRLTGPVRTVVDMMRMRSVVGEDRALEVLRDFVAGGGSIPSVRALADRFGAGRQLAPYLNSFSYMGR